VVSGRAGATTALGAGVRPCEVETKAAGARAGRLRAERKAAGMKAGRLMAGAVSGRREVATVGAVGVVLQRGRQSMPPTKNSGLRCSRSRPPAAGMVITEVEWYSSTES
jgi:hypothetical protein